MNKFDGFEDLMIYEEKADSKLRIINSAIYLFSVDGYMSTKTKAIAELAEVSEALVFKYYGNKQKLLGQVCTVIVEERIPAMFGYRLDELFRPGAQFTEEMMVDVVISKFRQLENNIGYFKVLFHEIDYNAAPIIEEVKEKVNGFWSYLGKGLEKLQNQGLLRKDLCTRTMVRSLSGMLFMLMMDRNFLGTEIQMEEELKKVLSLYMKGVGNYEER